VSRVESTHAPRPSCGACVSPAMSKRAVRTGIGVSRMAIFLASASGCGALLGADFDRPGGVGADAGTDEGPGSDADSASTRRLARESAGRSGIAGGARPMRRVHGGRIVRRRWHGERLRRGRLHAELRGQGLRRERRVRQRLVHVAQRGRRVLVTGELLDGLAGAPPMARWEQNVCRRMCRPPVVMRSAARFCAAWW
jgi:hypothetical protein